MIDHLGRKIEYLRISVTQNCNLNCIYCRPKAYGNYDKQCEKLMPSEFENAVRIMTGLGIKKVRITGGEPLARPDICDIVKRIAGIPGIDDLSMTTNGINLSRMAQRLKDSGLKRLNISLDSLKRDRFKYITGSERLGDVLEGINKAVSIGLLPVKINTVLIKGINDDEVGGFMQLTKDAPLEVRFIELMPVGDFGEKNPDKVVYNTDVIAAHPELIPCDSEETGQPARYYRIEGYKGKIGFISPMSHKFCSCCNRIRLTCDGKLKPCLGNNGEVDILKALRNNAGSLEEIIRKAIFEKPEGHNFGNSFSSIRGMSMIGG